ncbi:MmgE/PrpD family protein [Cnuibacter physcomitrellae]|uniref:MmgE/PrpD family protein n=1 Tax=Cnuibacter physcomitrellae TaxID=1619308 RepID=UPI002175BCF0|nr:MmgE/PrpD family protein [Cnuibacter physcomitrellae]MCS5498233.1 MmgE/PrpD family protein [Cnuibacter physcomitrellae]
MTIPPGGADAALVIARAAADLRFDDLSEQAVATAKRAVLDTLGASLAATGFGEEASALADVVREYATPRGVDVPGLGVRLPPLEAAFWWGGLAHSADLDDYADIVHPSAPIVSSVVPFAQARAGTTGRDLIVAIAAAQDLVVRIALSLRAPLGSYGWSPALPGVFGAALAGARLRGLDAAATANALGLALHQATGTMEAIVSPGSAVRSIRDGFNARAGALVAQLAEKGVPGDPGCFEGRYGLFPQYFGSDYDRDFLLDGLGRSFLGPRITIKPWPSAGHTHLYLTALDRLLQDPALTADDVESIVLTGGSELLVQQCEPLEVRSAPVRAVDARISLPFLVASFLRRRGQQLADFAPEQLADPMTIELARRVRWQRDASFRRGADGFGPAEVELVLKDGRRLRARVDQPRGHPDDPLSWDDLVAKFHQSVSAAAEPLPASVTATFADRVDGLEEIDDIAGLMSILVSGR